MRKICLILFLIMCTSLFACAKKINKMPYGAESIDYDKVEGVNKDGPTLSSVHAENVPPMAEKVIVEEGPWHIEGDKVEPTADMDKYPEYGDVPILETKQ